MIPYRVARIISAALVCGALLFCIIILSGCTTQEERMEGNKEMKIIEHEFKVFAEECHYGNGHLIIDSPANARRVQNAPVTVWEMKNAICKYDDEMYPVRLYYD